MIRLFWSACRVSLGFALGTWFGWGLGQHLLDLCAPDLIRPTHDAPDQVAAFLDQLPPIAHAMRLLANAAELTLGLVVLNRMGGSPKSEPFALVALFLLACLMDLVRVPHGLTLSLLTVGASLAAAWVGISATRTMTNEP